MVSLVDEERSEEAARLEERLAVYGPPTQLTRKDLPSNPDDEVEWNPAWALSVNGRPLYPCADYRLLRRNILLNTEGEVVDHPPPETPPWVHSSMTRRVWHWCAGTLRPPTSPAGVPAQPSDKFLCIVNMLKGIDSLSISGRRDNNHLNAQADYKSAWISALPLTWRGGTISRKLWTWRVSPLAYKTFYLFG